MKSKKRLLAISFLFISLISFSQQIGDGIAPIINDFTIPLKSGVYNGLNATGATSDNNHDWQHLFVIRHLNLENNHQLQISSSFTNNDRLFFRKIAADLNPSNPTWFELATRGVNTFNGNQNVNGELKISSYSPLLVLQRDTNVGGFIQGIQTKNIDNTDNWFFGNLQANSWIVSKGDFNNVKFTVLDNGNVGIGTSSPQSKLQVSGSITLPLPGTSEISEEGISFAPNHRFNYDGKFLNHYGFGFYPYSKSVDVGGVNTYMSGFYGLDFFTADTNRMRILINGNVGIGTTTPDQKLTVNGTIHAKEIIVDTNITPDYVFQKYYTGKSNLKSDYVMPTLAEIESFTKKNNHLPNVPSAQEVQQNGVSLGTMSNILLQKVEELTLYAIEQQKKLEEQNKTIATLAARLMSLEKK